MKRRIIVKKGCPVLHMQQNLNKNWFAVCKLGYSRKKNKPGVEDWFYKKISWIPEFITLSLDKTKLQPWKFCKNVLHLLEVFLMIFSWLPLDIWHGICSVLSEVPCPEPYVTLCLPFSGIVNCSFIWTEDLNFWSYHTMGNNLEYLLT